MIFTRKKKIGSVVLHRDRNPVSAAWRLRPHKSADPRWIRRNPRSAVVANKDLDLVSDLFRRRKPDPDLPGLSVILQTASSLGDIFDHIRFIKVEYDHVCRDHGPGNDQCSAGDRFRAG